MPVSFYGKEASPPCRAVLITAEAIGVKLEIKTINPTKKEHVTEEYLKQIPSFDANNLLRKCP